MMADDAPTYPVTGIPYEVLPSGEVPLRLEADHFFTKPECAVQRNLFLLAMAKFQAMDPKEKLSYFQIAGIHSQPYQTWDNPDYLIPGPQTTGYCSHNIITFPTWHRPYMLLFEQRVYEIMVNDVIPTFDASEHERLHAEARKWRLPYWDWAAKKQRPGQEKPVYDAALILKDKNVTVTTSTGPTSIPNPMYQFTAPGPMKQWGIEHVEYHDKPDGPAKYIEFEKCVATSKYPPVADVTEWIDGVQNVEDVTTAIQDHHWYEKGMPNPSLGEAVNRLLSLKYITKYHQFATTRHEPKDFNLRDTLSWEGIHNNLHNWIGGPWGDMAWPPVSAFDPVFWMHHANIDRIFAIYQALYVMDEKKSWWVKDVIPAQKDIPERTYTPATLLSPFHSDDKGTTYNSDDIRYHAKLGYTYPELQRWKFPSDPVGDLEYIASICVDINNLYPPSGELAICRNDYIVNVVYERFALGGDPFTVEILLRSEHGGSENWLVGSVYNFSSAQEKGCENCAQQKQSGALSSGQVTLTGALQARFKDPGSAFKDGAKDKVVDFLKGKLVYRVFNVEHTQVEMPSLNVSVAVGNLTISQIEKDGGGHTLTPIDNHAAGLPHLLGGVEHISELGGEYRTVITHHGSVYDVIKVTKGDKSIDVAHTGYSEYTPVDVEVLSI